MSDKAQTSISIPERLLTEGRALAKKEGHNNFSVVVERALVTELRAAGVDVGESEHDEAKILGKFIAQGKRLGLHRAYPHLLKLKK